VENGRAATRPNEANESKKRDQQLHRSSPDLRFQTIAATASLLYAYAMARAMTLSAFRITLYVTSTLGLVTLDIRL